MVTYTITQNERTASYERSQEDVRAGRIEKFASAEEMFKSLGI